jgi:hypothetical protein
MNWAEAYWLSSMSFLECRPQRRKVYLRIKSKWSIMNNARNLEPEMRLKAAQLNMEMGDWVHSLAPWQVISHLTFAREASFDSARRCYEKFMRTEMRGVSYFYALELNPAAAKTSIENVSSGNVDVDTSLKF